nr:MAG TPA: hypothetical protein [Caudoviricetes sp.]
MTFWHPSLLLQYIGGISKSQDKSTRKLYKGLDSTR